MTSRSNAARRSIGVSLGLIGLIVLGMCAWSSQTTRFDESLWKSNAGNYSEENPRAYMISAIERLLYPGDSREAVERLLGKPDSEDFNTLVYFLGRDFAGPSFCVYEIELNQQGHVIRQQWVRH